MKTLIAYIFWLLLLVACLCGCGGNCECPPAEAVPTSGVMLLPREVFVMDGVNAKVSEIVCPLCGIPARRREVDLTEVYGYRYEYRCENRHYTTTDKNHLLIRSKTY